MVPPAPPPALRHRRSRAEQQQGGGSVEGQPGGRHGGCRLWSAPGAPAVASSSVLCGGAGVRCPAAACWCAGAQRWRRTEPCPRLSCLSELARCRRSSRYSRAAADTHTAAALPTSYSYSSRARTPGHSDTGCCRLRVLGTCSGWRGCRGRPGQVPGMVRGQCGSTRLVAGGQCRQCAHCGPPPLCPKQPGDGCSLKRSLPKITRSFTITEKAPNMA